MNRERCEVLDKIRSPAGDCVTLTSYRDYVLRVLREDLTLDDVSALLRYFRCGVEELTDRIIMHKADWHTHAGRKGG